MMKKVKMMDKQGRPLMFLIYVQPSRFCVFVVKQISAPARHSRGPAPPIL